MKTYLVLSLLGLVVLTGCSADDLAGPDTASDAPLEAPLGARSDSDRAAPSASLFSVTGAWRASDDLGTITLFLDELGAAPDSSPSAAGDFGGKGIISGLRYAPANVTVEGRYAGRDISFTISDAHGSTIAKASGLIARDFSAIKVVLIDGTEQERTLLFERF